MDQWMLVLGAVVNGHRTSFGCTHATGLSVSHCSAYLCSLELGGLIECVGFAGRMKVYAPSGNGKSVWVESGLTWDSICDAVRSGVIEQLEREQMERMIGRKCLRQSREMLNEIRLWLRSPGSRAALQSRRAG